jgi:hypothetical protein
VQGKLRQQPLSVTIDTECAETGRPLQIQLDSELIHQVQQDAAPLFSTPLIDLKKLEDPSIIDAF